MRLSRVLKRMTPGMSGCRPFVTAAAVAVTALLAGGCDIKSFFDPSELFTNTSRPITNTIVTSLSTLYPSIDDPDEQFLNATDIRPEDLVVISQDYKIGKGDFVQVEIEDLGGTGIPTVKGSRVSESGNLSLALIGPVKAEGLTEEQLQKAIADAYTAAKIMNNPRVSATVQDARGKTFSAIGSVGVPNEYPIVKSEFRIIDAMVLFHDVATNVDTVYVVRQESEDPPPGTTNTVTTPSTPTKNVTPNSNPNPNPPQKNPIRDPLGLSKPPVDHPVYLQAAVNGQAGTGPGGYGYGTPTGSGVPSSVGGGTAGPGGANVGKFAFVVPPGLPKTRVISVPVDAIRRGDFRYNIVIRPHDLIIAPNPVVGFYYVGGHVGSPGAYTLSGQKLTLSQAIISARMLDGLAIPERTELTRRIGPTRQAMVRLNLAAIFAGTQPDIYLKPNDVVHVGTNILAPFIADLRNGFRITYGFGFLYDRNYAPQEPVR